MSKKRRRFSAEFKTQKWSNKVDPLLSLSDLVKS